MTDISLDFILSTLILPDYSNEMNDIIEEYTEIALTVLKQSKLIDIYGIENVNRTFKPIKGWEEN